MKFQVYVFSTSNEELPCYTREFNMQGCLEFPSLVDLIFYLLDLNEEVSLSLGIMVYDAQRQMLYYYVFYTCLNNKYSNNINDERKK